MHKVHFVFKTLAEICFNCSVLAHVHFDPYEAFQVTSELLLNIQHKVEVPQML